VPGWSDVHGYVSVCRVHLGAAAALDDGTKFACVFVLVTKRYLYWEASLVDVPELPRRLDIEATAVVVALVTQILRLVT
jgi:hypothetical protein